MNVLELYSGIGGMHLALNESGANGKVIAAVEINPAANTIYRHNFPKTKLLEANIEGLSVDDITKLGVDTILMSPPCQPFTRNGLQKDVNDPRTTSFIHVLNLLPHLEVDNILVENVKGFETSQMREVLVEALMKSGFSYQEFILNPNQFGIPNSRTRYYCVAKKRPNKFLFESDTILDHLPNIMKVMECFPISQIVETEVDNKYFLTETMIQKRFNIIDICSKESTRSCCFTKAYGRYFEGTGSIVSDRTMDDVKKVYSEINTLGNKPDEILKLLRTLNLRFFTPKEVSRLMCFPESFGFPNSISDSKRYMVLGNSINVKVVSYLIKYMNS